MHGRRARPRGRGDLANAFRARRCGALHRLVAATSDETAALACPRRHVASCLAERARDRGEHVLLVVDSVTRLAMALREIGPCRRRAAHGARLYAERLRQRCRGWSSGAAPRGRGAIAAVMTVLSETDDVGTT